MIYTKIKSKEEGVSIYSLLSEEEKGRFIACKINQKLYELTYTGEIKETDQIEMLELTDSEGVKIYERSLRFVISKAIYDLFPKLKFKISYSVSRSFSIQLFKKNNEPERITHNILQKLYAKINEIISANLEIKRLILPVEELISIYKKQGYEEKLDIMKKKTEVGKCYVCDNYYNYMYGYMVPRTGILNKFKMRQFFDGILVQYPRAECKGEIPEFEDSPTYAKTLKENAVWGKLVGVDSIAKINNFLKNYSPCDFINMCESHHNNMLAEIGERILEQKDRIRLICIAGPSSSGKTTFANRLRLELMSRGIKTTRISIDDYYKPREECPKDEDGNYDLETIEALKVDDFNRDILALIEGEKVALPIFDFKNKKHLRQAPIRIDDDEIIIIEGIHALNDSLTPSISRHQKFKIYIAPQAQINIDNQNPLSLTDLRLLRRIVRDYRTRGATPEDTISMWPSVRKGEFKWIYHTQEGADFVFNSLLPYELNIMKKHAYPILSLVSKDSPYFATTNKLMKFLQYLDPLDDKYIPNNSIMREFIGDSVFYDV